MGRTGGREGSFTVGRLGNRRLGVGSRQDAQGGQDGETGSPDWTFKEAKGDRRFTVGRIKGR